MNEPVYQVLRIPIELSKVLLHSSGNSITRKSLPLVIISQMNLDGIVSLKRKNEIGKMYSNGVHSFLSYAFTIL